MSAPQVPALQGVSCIVPQQWTSPQWLLAFKQPHTGHVFHVPLAAPNGVAVRAEPRLRAPLHAVHPIEVISRGLQLCCEGQSALDCSLS